MIGVIDIKLLRSLDYKTKEATTMEEKLGEGPIEERRIDSEEETPVGGTGQDTTSESTLKVEDKKEQTVQWNTDKYKVSEVDLDKGYIELVKKDEDLEPKE